MTSSPTPPTITSVSSTRSTTTSGRRFTKEEKGKALAALASGSSPEQLAPIIRAHSTTIRRWEKDPRVTGDSEVVAYAKENMRELLVLLSELTQDAAVALYEVIQLRDGKGTYNFTWSVCTLADKVRLLTGELDPMRTVTNGDKDRPRLLDMMQPHTDVSDDKQP